MLADIWSNTCINIRLEIHLLVLWM